MNISESIHEIQNRDEVVADLFYDIFLDRHPDVRQYFVNVDLKQQAIVLTMMLSVIEDFYVHSYPTTARYLRIVGHKHKVLGIPTNLYPVFAQCLLETLQRFHGTAWNSQLQTEWTEGIDKASRVLLEGY
jgi:hemoglobin-like flavoprotein